MPFIPKRNTREYSVYDLTTRELRHEIRQRTTQANLNIAKLHEYDEFNAREEKMLSKTKEATAYVNRKTGEIKIPKGRYGELGLGLSYKLKSELQEQLLQLRGFEEETSYSLDIIYKDIERANRDYDDFDEYDLDIPDDIEFSDKVQKQYDTFIDRYGFITKEDYLDMVDTFNNVKEALKSYGYEDLGSSLASKYVKANKEGKKYFYEYVMSAKEQTPVKTVEGLIDTLTDMMRADGVL